MCIYIYSSSTKWLCQHWLMVFPRWCTVRNVCLAVLLDNRLFTSKSPSVIQHLAVANPVQIRSKVEGLYTYYFPILSTPTPFSIVFHKLPCMGQQFVLLGYFPNFSDYYLSRNEIIKYIKKVPRLIVKTPLKISS